jgi:3-isopropylmalate/(R)-2-methylmalate dehydratase small subunit
MESKTGKVIVLGDHIDTDQIYPGRFLEIVEPKEIGRYCFFGISESIAPSFPKSGIIAAGRNFGCGSSREHAVIAILNMGAGLVIADSFARIFYRNAINLGLPLLICEGITGHVSEGQTLRVDMEEGIVENLDAGTYFQAEKIGKYALDILNAGGVKPLFHLNKLPRSKTAGY